MSSGAIGAADAVRMIKAARESDFETLTRLANENRGKRIEGLPVDDDVLYGIFIAYDLVEWQSSAPSFLVWVTTGMRSGFIRGFKGRDLLVRVEKLPSEGYRNGVRIARNSSLTIYDDRSEDEFFAAEPTPPLPSKPVERPTPVPQPPIDLTEPPIAASRATPAPKHQRSLYEYLDASATPLVTTTGRRNEAIIDKICRENGVVRINVPGDGYCLMNSVMLLMPSFQRMYLRFITGWTFPPSSVHIEPWIKNNRADFAGFLPKTFEELVGASPPEWMTFISSFAPMGERPDVTNTPESNADMIKANYVAIRNWALGGATSLVRSPYNDSDMDFNIWCNALALALGRSMAIDGEVPLVRLGILLWNVENLSPSLEFEDMIGGSFSGTNERDTTMRVDKKNARTFFVYFTGGHYNALMPGLLR